MALIKIRFLSGKTIGLTVGEVNAIEKMARHNGTDPETVQYGPGRVSWNTVSNLVRKGVLRREDPFHYFVEGLLTVQQPSTDFTLDTYRVES